MVDDDAKAFADRLKDARRAKAAAFLVPVFVVGIIALSGLIGIYAVALALPAGLLLMYSARGAARGDIGADGVGARYVWRWDHYKSPTLREYESMSAVERKESLALGATQRLMGGLILSAIGLIAALIAISNR